MSNILIVGWGKQTAERMRDQIDAVMKKHDWENDSATVIFSVPTRWCHKEKGAPYLVVRHSKAPQAEAIASALHSALNLDIEVEIIHKYLASVTHPHL